MSKENRNNNSNFFLPDSITTDTFRPIHYLGSKLRILDFLEETVNEIDNSKGRICDLFTGSGSVAHRFSKTRPVTAVDIQNYSHVICSALLNPNVPSENDIQNFLSLCYKSDFTKILKDCTYSLTSFEHKSITAAIENSQQQSLCDILENGSIISLQVSKKSEASKELLKLLNKTLKDLKNKKIDDKKSLALRYFGGIYFSYFQCVQIDSILFQISAVPNNFRNFFTAALLSTVSAAVNTVGKQFAQPIRPRKTDGTIKKTLGKKANKDRSIDIFILFEEWLKKYASIKNSNFEHSVLNMDYSIALDKLPQNTTVVYADPPYTRDHYSRFYHVLETIVLRDSPNISTSVVNGKKSLSRGLYRKDRHQSPFCIRSQAPKAFESMFSKVKNLDAKLVLSYSPFDKSNNAHPRVVSLDFLINLGNKYFDKVEITSPGQFSHSKLTNSEKHLNASKNAEVLIICQ